MKPSSNRLAERYARKDAMRNFFFVSETKQFMFLSVSKNACTSLKTMLYRIEFGHEFNREAGHGGIHNFFGFKERRGPGAMVDRTNRKELAKYAGFLRFTVYRDPVERFLSLYHNKVLWPPKPHPYFTKKRLEGLALDPFLDAVEEALQIPEALHIDEHIRPQRRCYSPEDVEYIVPLGALSRFLEEKFGIVSLPRQNNHPGVRIRASERQIERIQRLYREDYEIVPNYPLAVPGGTPAGNHLAGGGDSFQP